MRWVAKRLAAVVGCLPPQHRLECKHAVEFLRLRSGVGILLRPSTAYHGLAMTD